MNLIVVGETFASSRTVQRIRAFRELGHQVRVISTTLPDASYETRPDLLTRIRYRLRLPGDPAGANPALLQALEQQPADLVWFENVRMIHAATLRRIRRQTARPRLVWYGEDDMMNRRHRTRWVEGALPLFDLWVTTKSLNIRPDELPRLGVRRLLFVNNGFDPALHRPAVLTAEERERYASPITFVGTFEHPRASSLLRLAESGLKVRVWGNGWSGWVGRHPLLAIENRPAYNDEYAKIIAASAVNLCFLRKFNRDLQTCRSIEIPACGGFMIHERTDEMQALFEENREAVYFGGDDELVEHCRLWLADAPGRTAVAEAGRRRAWSAGLRHHDMLAGALDAAFREEP
ncbi:MAG: glycosyltransferase [Candidatus Hydrogenedens sp.]|nr:glycosyltransferase [Candidatus Hydrogenedens sp.]